MKLINKKDLTMALGLILLAGATESEAHARGRITGAIRTGVGHMAQGFRAAKNAVLACVVFDASTGQQGQQGQQGEGQRSGCVQTVVNQIKEATSSIGDVAQSGLDSWCSNSQVGESVRECNDLKQALTTPNARRALQAAQPNEFLQLIRARANALEGNAQDARCRRQSRELRACLLGIADAFSGQGQAQETPPAQQ